MNMASDPISRSSVVRYFRLDSTGVEYIAISARGPVDHKRPSPLLRDRERERGRARGRGRAREGGSRAPAGVRLLVRVLTSALHPSRAPARFSAKARVVPVAPEGLGPVGLRCRAAPQLEGRRAAEVAQVAAEALREGEGELVESLQGAREQGRGRGGQSGTFVPPCHVRYLLACMYSSFSSLSHS